MAESLTRADRIRQLPKYYRRLVESVDSPKVPSEGFLRLLEAETRPGLREYIAVGGLAIPGLVQSERLTRHMADLAIGGPDELPLSQREALAPLRGVRQKHVLTSTSFKALIRPVAFSGLPLGIRGPEAVSLHDALKDGLKVRLLTGDDGPLNPHSNYCVGYTKDGPWAYEELMAFEAKADGTLGTELYDRSRYFEVGSAKAKLLGEAASLAWAQVDNDDALRLTNEFLASTAAAA